VFKISVKSFVLCHHTQNSDLGSMECSLLSPAVSPGRLLASDVCVCVCVGLSVHFGISRTTTICMSPADNLGYLSVRSADVLSRTFALQFG
jgi:hypothetical protein